MHPIENVLIQKRTQLVSIQKYPEYRRILYQIFINSIQYHWKKKINIKYTKCIWCVTNCNDPISHILLDCKILQPLIKKYQYISPKDNYVSQKQLLFRMFTIEYIICLLIDHVILIWGLSYMRYT